MNKKMTVLILTAALLLVGGVSAFAGAAISFSFYGKASNAGEIKLIDDRAYVPIRDLAEALGAEVSYDVETRTIDYRPVDLDRLPPTLSRYFNAYEKEDWEAVAAVYAKDGKFYDPNYPDGLPADQLAAYLTAVDENASQYGPTDYRLLFAYEVSPDQLIGIWQLTVGGQPVATGPGLYTVEGNELKEVRTFQFPAPGQQQ